LGWLTPDGFAAPLWLGLALALAAAELVLPGIYLIFIAAGPLATALAVWWFAPALTGQLVITAGAALLACLGGVAVYRRSRASGDAAIPLNQGFDWLIGQSGVIAEPSPAGETRIQIAGGLFPATGVDLAVGRHVRVVGVESGVLRVVLAD
jgi:inner membrane protein